MDLNKVLNQFSALSEVTPEQQAAHDEAIRQKEEEQREKEKINRYRKSGAPERYLQESFETYKVTNEMQTKAATAAVAFVHAVKRGEFRSLVFIGSAGVGKTHLSCAIVRETGGKYRTSSEIVEELRRAKSFSAKETEAEILEYYGHVSLLVIDEIGRGIAATDEKYMLYQVLNARYNTCKPTVLISNHNKADFLQYIGAAAADRLVESAEIYELEGESYRRELRGK